MRHGGIGLTSGEHRPAFRVAGRRRQRPAGHARQAARPVAGNRREFFPELPPGKIVAAKNITLAALAVFRRKQMPRRHVTNVGKVDAAGQAANGTRPFQKRTQNRPMIDGSRSSGPVR